MSHSLKRSETESAKGVGADAVLGYLFLVIGEPRERGGYWFSVLGYLGARRGDVQLLFVIGGQRFVSWTRPTPAKKPNFLVNM